MYLNQNMGMLMASSIVHFTLSDQVCFLKTVTEENDQVWLSEVTQVDYLVFINIYGFSNCILQNI
jgi:hypothetical protein